MAQVSLRINKFMKIKLIAVTIVALIMLATPLFTFSSHSHNIYVDDSASGTQDGSTEHPYKTIGDAMDHADENTQIHVAKGTYNENIKIKKGVEIYGSDQEDVVIDAHSDSKPAVEMNGDTLINKVTIKGGQDGIKVNNKAKASIIKCTVKNADDDGIHIVSDGLDKDKMVSISESLIEKNNRAGIYSGKRRLSITDNEIRENGSDGIVFESGISAWIAGNKIAHNMKSGMRLILDGANIWTKSNTIRDNRREGIEVNWSGAAGRIDIAKTKFWNNERFAVARVQRANFDSNRWNSSLTFDNRNQFVGSKLGDISKVFVITR
ncbi:MAG: right-handed parallel beta-helix repeat-containing protein [Candidatus Moranbacteria bacterium]|nr:right-handed parallel beta-helix repeat-containing protein [Candidatus Moranbacteria bacterium]